MVNFICTCVCVLLVSTVTVNCIKWNAFSTKTAYEWAHVLNQNPQADELYTFTQSDKTCKAIHVNGVYRHGSRNPSDGSILKIERIHQKIKANKKIGNYPFIDTWTNPYDIKSASELVLEGQKELKALGNILVNRLRSLLKQNSANLKMVSSRKNRAMDSGLNFALGMGLNRNKFVLHLTTRLNDGCKNYVEQVEDNATNLKQFTEFNKGLKFTEVTNALKTSLGLNISLSQEEVYVIYDLCAYGKYINDRTDWCQLLSDSQRKILEYGQDIEKWYESSYGHPLNTKLACPLVSDMFLTMDAAMNDEWKYTSTGVTDYSDKNINNSGYLAGKFQFGHSETVVQLFTALGLFKDSSPLLANNMDKMSNRKFKSSDIIPYAGNLVFIVYACDSTANLDSSNVTMRDREYYIKLLVNEAPITIPGCVTDTCLYSTVRNMYKDHIDNCNILALCNDAPTDAGTYIRAGLMIPLMVLLRYILF